jgi:hypothetical protein
VHFPYFIICSKAEELAREQARCAAFDRWKKEVDELRVELRLTPAEFQRMHDKLLKPPTYEIDGQLVFTKTAPMSHHFHLKYCRCLFAPARTP